MRVFVVGNIVMDEAYAVKRVPAEGESVLGERILGDLGGKGANQAIVIARCGVDTVLIAATGNDAQSSFMTEQLAQEPVAARLISLPDQHSDKSIVLKDANGGNAIVTTVNCARSLTSNDVSNQMVDAKPGDLLVLQGNLSMLATTEIIADARSRKMKVVLNPSPVVLEMKELLSGLDILFLNEHEALQLTDYTDMQAVEYLRKAGVKTVVLTRGADGAILGSTEGIFCIPAQPCSVLDSTGAGDTLQGVAIAAALQRKEMINVKILETAAAAATITVSRQGTAAAFPSQDEFSELLKEKLR